MLSINERLKSLYLSKWDNLLTELYKIDDDENKIGAAYPILLSVNEDKLKEASLKIMFFGQEPNVWDASETVEGLMKYYRQFVCCDSDFNVKRRGHFWNGVKKIIKLIQNERDEEVIYPIYNNVIKVGKINGPGRPPEYTYKVEREYFNVILEEISILKPDICIFFTGPHYDDVISDIFGRLDYIPLLPFSNRELAKLNIPNVSLSIRTYHPRYLYGNSIEDYFDCILLQIQKNKKLKS